MRVLITTSSFGAEDPRPLDLLRKHVQQVDLNPHKRKLTEEELIALLGDAVGLVGGVEPITDKAMGSAPNLKVVSRVGTGLDNVDLEAAEKRGIKVYRTSSPADAVAELALALILDAMRGVSRADRSVRAGKWDRPFGRLLRDKTVGIVGFGLIGRRMAELLKPFGGTILAVDPVATADAARAGGARLVPLAEMLPRADVVTVHAPLTDDTRGMFNAARFDAMKAGAVFVNTSRGELVDEPALAAALQSGKLFGAALDVFSAEPYKGPLVSAEKLILSPHIGGYAVETRVDMELEAVRNLFDGLGLKA